MLLYTYDSCRLYSQCFDQQVSRHFQHLINNDKTLWTSILDREVLAQDLSLHPNRIETVMSSAAQVQSWVRCAFLLRRSYSRTTKTEKTRLKLDLGVTWLRVARARWCIVASSDTLQSRLSVYDLSGNIRLCEVFYLPGPVVAGIVEDNNLGIRLALTVGTV